MNSIDRMNKALQFIEENLGEDIDLDQVSKIAGCSKFYFQRIFTALSEVSLSEYIRKRRMTKAAVEIKNTDKKLIDIANEFNYATASAFNRAFKEFHGISPSLVRSSNPELVYYPPLQFHIKIIGGQTMQYKLKEMDKFTVSGVSIPISADFNQNTQIVPEFWEEITLNGTLENLSQEIQNEPLGILGLSRLDDNNWRYYIGISGDHSGDYEKLEVPKATWAIFKSRGKNTDIQKLMKQVLTEWLPNSGYRFGNGPDMEVYKSPDPNDMVFEYWIPVIPNE